MGENNEDKTPLVRSDIDEYNTREDSVLTSEDIKCAINIIVDEGLFDEEYFNTNYPEVSDKTDDLLDYYLTTGYKQHMNPSEGFDNDFYMFYPEIKDSDINPLVYYVLYGLDNDNFSSNNLSHEQVNYLKQIILQNNLFDKQYYLEQCPAIKEANIDPLEHYLLEGYIDNLNPSRDFSTLYYKQKYLGGLDNINPLLDYAIGIVNGKKDVQTNKELAYPKIMECVDIIYESNTFDEQYYRENNPGVDGSIRDLIHHYILNALSTYPNPNKFFDTKYYLENNPEVVVEAINPYYHYLTKGRSMNLSPLPTRSQQENQKKIEDSYKKQAEVIGESKYFDEDYYIKKYSEIRNSLLDPLDHYTQLGYKQKKNPSRFFDNNYYLYKYNEEIPENTNPLYHYIVEGKSRANNIKQYLTREDKEIYEAVIREDIERRTQPSYDSSMPLVSILILNHNGHEYLDNLFNSLVSNTHYPNIEVLFIDNDSTDDSIGIATSYSDKLPIQIITNQINKTYSEAYNESVEHARGEYIVFMDSDVELFDGWLSYLMETMLANSDCGAVGSKLLYPDGSRSQDNTNTSYKIQHAGIKFIESCGEIQPYYNNKYHDYTVGQDTPISIPAVTGSLMLTKKTIFEEVEGFDENYVYGYEAVDLCLKLLDNGYTNYYDPRSMAYHTEHGTLKNTIEGVRNNRDLQNKDIFTRKWNTQLKRKILLDKLYKRQFYSDSSLKITFITLEKGDNAAVGDYFVALGLAKYLRKDGYEVDFISTNQEDKYVIDESIDVVISLVNSYDISKIQCDNNLLIKVAWILNWAKWWIEKPYFESYDIVLCAHRNAQEYICQKSGYDPTLFYEATDDELFNQSVEPDRNLECDYCFAGNDWHDEREITELLEPSLIPYKFNIYGKTWANYPKFDSNNKGFIRYEDIPKLYASTKIVLDDSTQLTDTDAVINNRVFDALAMGVLVLSTNKDGSNELFDGQLPVFDSTDSLREQLELYIEDTSLREDLIEKLQSIVLDNHTYRIRSQQFIGILDDFINSTRVMIKIPTPRDANKFEWGDYHMAVQLQKEFNRQQSNSIIQLYDDWKTTKDSLYDVVLVLRGVSLYEPKSIHYNILWNISHPNRISVGELEQYNQVYIASDYWAKKMGSIVSVKVDSLLQCTNPERFRYEYDENYDTQLLFVGNSRMIFRKILYDLLPTEYDLDVYGNNWEDILDTEYIKGNYIPNDELYKAYSSADILLNDHWDDMRTKGFISNRIFDGIACGTVIMTDHVAGIEDVFGDAVVVYDKPEELNSKIKQALNRGVVDPGLIEEHTFKKRVERILSDYRENTQGDYK
ncbi:MAG: glycosyltransferase [Methanosphaera sp.]|nr:glycosyltransferase [Methanosphaera sp.]